MNLQGVRRDGEYRWVIEPEGEMRVPAVLYADEVLLADMDDKVRQQLRRTHDKHIFAQRRRARLRDPMLA